MIKWLRTFGWFLGVSLFGSVYGGNYVVSVKGADILLNGTPIKIIGLRCSNALISDEETQELIDNLAVFKSYGVNTVSVFLMGSRFGDVKGYLPDASLNPVYANRLGRIIEAADREGMIVLVGCLYWSTSRAKEDLSHWTQEDANRAIANTVRWLSEHNYRNVFVDVDNEGMAHDRTGWSIAAMIDAGHAVDPTIMLAYNDSDTPPDNADIYIHHSPKVAGRPWVQSEGTPTNAPGGYWGSYSKMSGYYNYIRIGRYTESMKQNQIAATDNDISKYNGYMLASTYLQCAPFEGVGGPFMNPGGRAENPNIDENVKEVQADAGILWWLEHIKAKYGPWTPPDQAKLSIERIMLVNAATNQDIRPLYDGAIINLHTDGQALSIRAESSGAESVRFQLTGGIDRIENTPPYALLGDSPAGDYNPWTPTPGSYTLTMTPYSANNAGGQAGTARTITFTVIDEDTQPQVTGLVLVNAESDQDIAPVSDGDVIDLAETGNKLSLRAEVNAYTGSVVFGVNDDPTFQVENNPVYALKGNQGSDYHAWTPSPGQYTISVTPYPEDNAGGTAGPTMTVHLTIVDQQQNTPPLAQIDLDLSSGRAPLTVQFDAGNSTDPDGTITSYFWDFGDGTTSTQPAPVHTFTVPGTYTVTLTVKDNDGASATTNVEVIVEAATPVYAINCGGPEFVRADGTVFLADTMYSDGKLSKGTSDPIASTSDDPLYQSARYGNFSYTIPLPNGTYVLKLMFNELYWDQTGKRRFDVQVEGSTVIDNLDLVDVAGHDTAYDMEIPVQVSDGQLNIDFIPEVNNAIISAIVIE